MGIYGPYNIILLQLRLLQIGMYAILKVQSEYVTEEPIWNVSSQFSANFIETNILTIVKLSVLST